MPSQDIIFKTLSDTARLRILHLFLASGEPLCVCEIVDTLKLPQYQISRHLAVLKEAGFLDLEKRGTWAYHSLRSDDPLKEKLYEYLEEHFEGEEYDRDLHRLRLRLALREGGRCVVGFVGEKELNKLLQTRYSVKGGL